MSSPSLASPDPRQQQTQMQAGTTEQEQQQSIANLAYTLWQQRGCPQGSSEQDWLDAEQLLQVGEIRQSLSSSR